MRKLFYLSLVCGLLLSCGDGTNSKVDRSCPMGYDKSYQVQQIDSTTWLINESDMATIYLVAGKEKAALIDAGVGTGDIRRLAGSLTTLPVTMYNTHGHSDHIGGDYMFDEVYMSLADTLIYNDFFNPENRRQSIKHFIDNNKDFHLTEEEIEHLANTPPAKVKDLKEGDVIDLGGRDLEVVAMPGHTAGSLIFLDRTHKFIFSGDVINVQMWMWLEEALPLDVYDNAIRRVRPMFNEFERIYNGHERQTGGLAISHVDSIISHLDAIKAKRCKVDTMDVWGNKVPCYTFNDWKILLKK